ncbi:unnamed protein product [Linum trigynum]|uniref:Retrotransposon gag domain-containing protein n=1 Tax=Linum trigynum TaxID=586398 RepID=A0AAV2DY21_9ROSI
MKRRGCTFPGSCSLPMGSNLMVYQMMRSVLLCITSWDDLADKFVHRYDPASKTTEIQWEITHLRQELDESLRDAWERYSGFFWQCPHHDFSDAFTVGNFYSVLSPESQRVIECLCSEVDIFTKTPPELNQMINTLAARDHSWGQH